MHDGLTDDERSTLTHFTTRLVDLLVCMREAWAAADEHNAHAIEIAIAILICQSHSTRRNLSIVRKVLSAGNERADELIANVSVRVLDVGAMAARLKNIMEISQEMLRSDVQVMSSDGSGRNSAQEIEAAAGACLLIFNETTEAPRPDWLRSLQK